MATKLYIVKDIGLICFIAIVLAIGFGLYKYFVEKSKQDWNKPNNEATVGKVIKF